MSIRCAVDSLPEIDRAGEFPLLNPVFEFTYRNPTHVLHLYGYHGKIRIDSREFRFRPGDLTCIQAGSVYSLQTDAPGKHWCIHFSDRPGHGGSIFEIPDLVPLGANSPSLREQIKFIASLLRTSGDRERAGWMAMEARHRLKALLLSIHNLRWSGTSTTLRSSIDWEDLVSWVEDHLDQPLTIAGVADHAGVGANTLARIFKQRHQTTFARFVLLLRIDRAKSLLATTTLPVCDVGSSVGIPDPQYFNKQFRRVAGLSPGRFRESHGEYFHASAAELATREGTWQSQGAT